MPGKGEKGLIKRGDNLLKLLVLLLLPGFFVEFAAGDNRIRYRAALGKRMVNSLLYGYFVFLLDVSALNLLCSEGYPELLDCLSRRMKTVEDLSLFASLLSVQVLIASGMAAAGRLIKYRGIEGAFVTVTSAQRSCALGAILFSVMGALFTFAARDNAEQGLVINEVCSKNDSVVFDESGNYSDYVEIYNPSGWNVSLTGFQLSEQRDLKKGLQLGNIVIPAKGYSVVWLNEESASFGISSKGESIYLANADGEIVDAVEVPKLKRNVSYARATDGADEWQEQEASPALANDPLKRHLEAPEFSAESGFYDEEFLLSIQAGEGEKIYYTLDCSIPDENAELYTEEILVKNVCEEPNIYLDWRNVVLDWDNYNPNYDVTDKLFVVRAVAVDDYGNTSDVVTKNYLVDMEQYKNQNILSIVAEPDDLFGTNGISVTGEEYDEWYAGDRDPASIVANFYKKGRGAEIEASLLLLNNSVLMEQEVGVRIQGASARDNAFKRYAIYARKEYSGSRYFDYDLFGRDTHAMFTRGSFAESLIHSLVEDRNVGTQRAVPITMFLEGECWYGVDLREKYNEDYLSTVYHVPRDKAEIRERVPGELVSFIESHDLSKAEDYRQLCEMMDVQSYIDYMAINIYVCNMDISEDKNYRVWRTTEKTDDAYGDQRFRWLLYDVDSISWYGSPCYTLDSFSEKNYVDLAMNQHVLYKALRANEEFCARFVLTFMDIVNHNFSYHTVEEQMARWGYDMSWNVGFFENRPTVMIPALAKEFDLQGTPEEITLCVNNQMAGYVQINTITPELTDGSWTGSYYTDYPVTITAVANKGHKFVGWKCEEEMVKDAQIEVRLTTGGCRWEAVFE